MNYDLVIIGAGPAGLALAQCVSHLNKKVLIIDREKVIGGCHRVRRVKGLFTEHGPRVYSTTYMVFQDLLKEMGVKFTDLFTNYNFSITQIGGETVFSTLTWGELFLLFIEFSKLMLNDYHGRNVILENFLNDNKFNTDSIEMIDRVCKLTDGGGVDKYTLYEFLQLFNQQFFYSLYQPKYPNDEGLMTIWKKHLESKNVEFYLDTTIKQISVKENNIDSLEVSHDNYLEIIKGDKYIFAIPPQNLYNLMSDFSLSHSWGDLKNFSQETAYIDYLSVSFHWNKKLSLNKVYGFPKSSWGVAFVVLSDYMTFNESDSKTVISAAVTISNRKSKNNNKTADECSDQELVDEIFLQLQEAYPNLPPPTISIISPGVKFNKDKKKWISEDTAYIITSGKGYLPFKNEKIQNMYNLGTHNGKSFYKFTSLESAVSNSVVLSKELYPELKSSKYIKLSRSTSISDVFDLLMIVLIIYLIYYGIINGGKRYRIK
jgi:uncharacterized protein with NAD-binding domain and iron-sulfur cluster